MKDRVSGGRGETRSQRNRQSREGRPTSIQIYSSALIYFQETFDVS